MRFFLRVWLGMLFVVVSCHKSAPPPKVKPKKKKQISIVKKLEPVFLKIAVDDRHLDALKKLEDYVNKHRDAKDWKDAVDLYGWNALRLLAVAMIKAPDRVESITGGTIDNPVALKDFANKLKILSENAGDNKLKSAAEALGVLVAKKTEDKDIKLLYYQAKHVPAIRLILMDRLVKELQRVLDAPEFLRKKAGEGLALLLPEPPRGSQIGDYLITEAGKRLVELSNAGLKAYPGVANVLHQEIINISTKLSKKIVGLTVPYKNPAFKDFAMPDVKWDRESPTAVVAPVDVITITKDAAYFGSRPLLQLQASSVSYMFGSKEDSWPGIKVLTDQKITKKVMEEAEKLLEKGFDIAGKKEAILFKNIKLKEGMNKDRTGVLGRSALVVVSKDAGVDMVKKALELFYKEHYTDFRIVRPDDHTRVIPVLYKKVLPLKDVVENRGRARAYVWVGDKALKLMVASKRCLALPTDMRKLGPVPKVIKPKKGLQRAVVGLSWEVIKADPPKSIGSALGVLEKMCGKANFVNVNWGKKTSWDKVLQALYGVVGYGDKNLEFADKLFVGIACPPSKDACITRVPVLFGPAGPPRAAKVTQREPLGFCDPGDIRRTILRRIGRIRACYEMRLQRAAKKFSGRLQLRFTIGLDGKITKINPITDTVGDKNVTRCVIKTMKRLKFKKPKGGVCVVQWPFVFRPR